MVDSHEVANKWIAGAIAGCTEAIVTMPFEVIKTKLQMSKDKPNWKASIQYDSAGRSFLRSSYAGLTPILLQTSMKVGIRFAAYEALKPITGESIGGFLAGAFEAFIWVAPTERLKVLFITNGKLHHSIVGSSKILIQSQGITGLWRGGTATVLRNSLTVGTRFWFYSKFMEFFKPFVPTSSSEITPAISGFCSGMITTIMFQPIDCVKTHMGADRASNTDLPKYSSNWDCIKKIWSSKGFKGFMSGLSARMIKIPLGQTVIFYVQEKAFKYLNTK